MDGCFLLNRQFIHRNKREGKASKYRSRSKLGVMVKEFICVFWLLLFLREIAVKSGTCVGDMRKKNSDLLNSSYLNNPFISHAMPPSTSIKDVSIAIHVLQITRKVLGVVLKLFANLEIANHSFLWILSHYGFHTVTIILFWLHTLSSLNFFSVTLFLSQIVSCFCLLNSLLLLQAISFYF